MVAPQHFPVVEYSGTPYEVGRAQGRDFAAAIRQQAMETLALDPRGPEAALHWTAAQVARIDALSPAWREEMQGLADGAGLSWLEIAALQVRPGSGRMPEGCTAVAVGGQATRDAAWLCGQNRDLAPGYRARMCVLRLRMRGQPTLVMHSVPGELGGVGLNGQGLCVFANSLWAVSGRTWMAPPLLRRAILECASAEEAVARVQAMDGPAVGSFLVGDPTGARNLEILPEGVAVQSPEAGQLAHANHCLAGELRRHEVQPLPSPGSPGRCARMGDLLAARAGGLDMAGVRACFSDHDSRPEAICRHAVAAGELETAASLIVEPALRKLHLSYGPPCAGAWATFVAD